MTKNQTFWLKRTCCISFTQVTARVWPNTLKSTGVLLPNRQRWTAATTKTPVTPRCTGTDSVQERPWPWWSTQFLADSQITGSSLRPNIQPLKKVLRAALLLWRTCSWRTPACIFVLSANTVMWEGNATEQKLVASTFGGRCRIVNISSSTGGAGGAEIHIQH